MNRAATLTNPFQIGQAINPAMDTALLARYTDKLTYLPNGSWSSPNVLLLVGVSSQPAVDGPALTRWVVGCSFISAEIAIGIVIGPP